MSDKRAVVFVYSGPHLPSLHKEIGETLGCWEWFGGPVGVPSHEQVWEIQFDMPEDHLTPQGVQDVLAICAKHGVFPEVSYRDQGTL